MQAEYHLPRTRVNHYNFMFFEGVAGYPVYTCKEACNKVLVFFSPSVFFKELI